MPREESVNTTSKTAHSNAIEEPTATLGDDCIKDEEEISTPASFDPIDIKDFESLGVISSVSSISHTIDKGQIPDSSAIWFRKEFTNPAAARREWLAQEFLRLIIPNQTETRLAFNSSSNVYYILSKEVPGFKPLPTHEHHKFSNGTYKGLGRIIMGAYFVHEADLKNGNVGIGDDDMVHKIDGDWSFASMRSNGQFPKYTGSIAAVQINRLPFPMTYKAHNWLDIFIEGSLASASDIVASDIGSSSQFQEEKFETLFKLLLIPNEYFNQFVDSFMPAGAKEYSDFLIARRNILLQQAPRVQGFSQYLTAHRDVLEDMAMSFQEQMKQFVIQGKYSIVDNSKYQPFHDLSKAQFNEVLAKFEINLSLHGSLEELKEAPTVTPPTPTLANTLENLGIFSYKPCGSKRKLVDLIGDYADFTFKP